MPDNNKPIEYAVKVFKKDYREAALLECNHLKKFNKPSNFNIIKPILDVEACKLIGNTTSHFLVTPYYLHNLKNILQEKWSNDLKLVQHIFAGIVRGVYLMHSEKIAHVDLKPSNIVISKDLAPLIIDFGHA